MLIFENHYGRHCQTIEVDDIDEATETLFVELEGAAVTPGAALWTS